MQFCEEVAAHEVNCDTDKLLWFVTIPIFMGVKTLSKWDKIELFAQVLTEKIPNEFLTHAQFRTMIARCLNVTSRRSYLEQLETLSDVFFVVELVPKVGIRILPAKPHMD